MKKNLTRNSDNVWNTIILNTAILCYRYERLTGIQVTKDFPSMKLEVFKYMLNEGLDHELKPKK